MQGGEPGQEVDQLPGRGRGRAGGLHLVPPPHGRSPGRGHGVDHQRGPGRGVGEVSLPGGGGQGAVPGVQGGEEPQVALHGEPVHLRVGGGQRLGAVAEVLVVLRLDFGALGQLEADPVAGFRLADRGVLLP